MSSNSPFDTYAIGIPFPEGPVFDAHGQLFVCARRDGYLARITSDGTVHRHLVTGGKPNGLAVDGENTLYLADAVGHRVLSISQQRDMRVLVFNGYDGHRLVGPNDLCLGPAGELYFTDPGLSFETDDGSIFRFDLRTGTLTALSQHHLFPNGLALSDDGAWLYFTETSTCALFALHTAGAFPQTPRRLLTFGDGAMPDGMTWIDRDHLLIALHGSGEMARVHVRDLTERRWSTGPDSHPTNVVLHGNGCFVTEDTQACVLRCDLGRLRDG